jgi:predicted NUDIX family NTP pyrophosphohydrolase
MPGQVSAGVLAWRDGPSGPEFLLVHPGGPYWRGKDEAAWGLPKGLAAPGEDLLAAARREFEEELGRPVVGTFEALSPCRLARGKTVHAWLVEADVDLSSIRSNTFEMEWPPRSGRMQAFPEIDQAAYVPDPLARARIHRGQRPILDEALARIEGRRARPGGVKR